MLQRSPEQNLNRSFPLAKRPASTGGCLPSPPALPPQINSSSFGPSSSRGAAGANPGIMVACAPSALSLTTCGASSAKCKRTSSAINVKIDQYVLTGMAGMQKAIISWDVGKRNAESTTDLLHDLPSPRYRPARDFNLMASIPSGGDPRQFGADPSRRVNVTTYSVTHLVKEAQGHYSPTAVVAVSGGVIVGRSRPTTLSGRTFRCASLAPVHPVARDISVIYYPRTTGSLCASKLPSHNPTATNNTQALRSRE